MPSGPRVPRSRDDFKVAIICALSSEAGMVEQILDKVWSDENKDFGKAAGDSNNYTTGVIGKHNVVLSYMPRMGNISAAVVAGIKSSFQRIEIALVVGICGVVPIHLDTGEEILLGDCIVSTGVVQYDMGKKYPGGFVRKEDNEGSLGKAHPEIRSLIAKLKTPRNLARLKSSLVTHLAAIQSNDSKSTHPGTDRDRLFQPSYVHSHQTVCDACLEDVGVCQRDCDTIGCDLDFLVKRVRFRTAEDNRPDPSPRIHFGRFGSANTVMKCGQERDRVSQKESVIAFEMESSGVWDYLPTVVVKSASDYADSHKSKEWQLYAAATAAAATKSILEHWQSSDVANTIDKPILSAQTAFNLPDIRVAHFVARQQIYTEIQAWLDSDGNDSPLILLGMGGAGKSQLALEYCQRALASKAFSTVLWLDATSPTTLEQSYKLIASKLIGSDSVSNNVDTNLEMISSAIASRGHTWLAVFDNYDDPEAFAKHRLAYYFPKAEGKKILVTSRNGSSSRVGRAIRIEAMTVDESVKLLLLRNAYDESEQQACVQIAQVLGYLALALDQAGSYMRARSLRPQDFMEHYKQRKRKILEDLPPEWEYSHYDIGTGRETALSTFTTWDLSFGQIKGDPETKRHKEHFLSMIAFFDRSAISKRFFEAYATSADEKAVWTSIFKTDGKWDDFKYTDMIADFQKLSLLHVEEHSDQDHRIGIHPLIYEWLKLRIPSEQQDSYAEEFSVMLGMFFEVQSFFQLPWVIQARIIANVNSCLGNDPRLQNAIAIAEDDALRWLVLRIIRVQKRGGHYKESEALAERLLSGMEKTSRIKDPVMVQVLHLLALLCHYTSRHERAFELLERSLAIQKETAVLDVSRHADIMDTYAVFLRSQKQFGKAEDLLRDFLEQNANNDDLSRQARWSVQGQLAQVLALSKKHAEAEELFDQVLTGQLSAFGSADGDVLNTKQRLLTLYIEMGRHDDAKKISVGMLDCFEQRRGPTHRDTLKFMLTLGALYSRTGEWDAAEDIFHRALAGCQLETARYHDTIPLVIYCLAQAQEGNGKLVEAEASYLQALAGYGARSHRPSSNFKACSRKLARLQMKLRPDAELKESQSITSLLSESHSSEFGNDSTTYGTHSHTDVELPDSIFAEEQPTNRTSMMAQRSPGRSGLGNRLKGWLQR